MFDKESVIPITRHIFQSLHHLCESPIPYSGGLAEPIESLLELKHTTFLPFIFKTSRKDWHLSQFLQQIYESLDHILEDFLSP